MGLDDESTTHFVPELKKSLLKEPCIFSATPRGMGLFRAWTQDQES